MSLGQCRIHDDLWLVYTESFVPFTEYDNTFASNVFCMLIPSCRVPLVLRFIPCCVKGSTKGLFWVSQSDGLSLLQSRLGHSFLLFPKKKRKRRRKWLNSTRAQRLKVRGNTASSVSPNLPAIRRVVPGTWFERPKNPGDIRNIKTQSKRNRR